MVLVNHRLITENSYQLASFGLHTIFLTFICHLWYLTLHCTFKVVLFSPCLYVCILYSVIRKAN